MNQAKAVGKAFKEAKLDGVYASPLVRLPPLLAGHLTNCAPLKRSYNLRRQTDTFYSDSW